LVWAKNMSLIKSSAVYLGTSVINKALPFLMLPVLTQYLPPSDFGILSLFLVFYSLYNAFVGMNIHANISKNFFSCSRQELAIIVGNIFYILCFSAVLLMLITLVMSYFRDRIFSIPSNTLLILPLLSVFMMVNSINLTILRNEARPYIYGIFEITNSFINVTVTLIFLLIFDKGWLSQIYGLAVANAVMFVVSIVYMTNRNYIKTVFVRSKIEEILKLSMPFIPHILGGIIIAVSDRMFIEKMVGLEAVALYSVGYSFGMIIMLFTDAFIKAWSPWFYKCLAKPDESKKKQIVRYTRTYVVVTFMAAGAISVVAKFILPFMVTEEFHGANEFVFAIAIGYAVQGIYKIFYPYLVHIGKTSFLAISSLSAAILNLFLNYVLIKWFGVIGAAYSTIGAFSLSALMVFWFQNKYYPMPWMLRISNG